MKHLIKRNIIISFGIALCFAQSSCKKDFLTKTDPTSIDKNLFYKNQAEMEQAVNGVYGQLQGIINGQWVYNELPSDNTTVDFDPGNRGFAPTIEAFEFFNVNSGTGNINDMYIAYYGSLFNVNNTLLKLKNSTIADSVKGPFDGQLKFL